MKDLPMGTYRDGELLEKPIEYTRHRYGYGGNVFELYDSMSGREKEKLRRYIRAAHYGSLTLIDERIGDILGELMKRRQLDNTIIIYTSDHGSALFDNNMLHKGTHFDTQVRVPFIVWWPRRIKAGVRSHFSSHVDLFPTIMQLIKGRMPAGLEGKSLVPLLNNPDSSVQNFAVMECTFVTSIISDKWRIGFHHYNNEVDLYDVQKDPHSLYNLADKPEYANVIEMHRKQLVNWRRALNPDMNIPEDPFQWRECLGPQDIVSRQREGYLKQYRRLALIDETKRPGKVGKYVLKYLSTKETG
jgi:arylsulfatase A-like enzyme